MKIRPKFQITLPADLCREHGISAGDLVEVTADKAGRLVLTPKVVVDKKTSK